MQKFTGVTLAAIALAVTAGAGSPVAAQSAATLGTLTCRGGAGVGLILGSNKTYACTFERTDGGPPESYEATVTRIGLDIGITGEATMVWTVLASTPGIAAGERALTGTYTGASADAAVGIGGGAKVLVGGSRDAIVLQPLSVQGQTGLNIAVGVASMRLD